MSGLGEQIATAREKRGLTAADAARQLHLRTDFITAIDAEQWTRLGPPIYARGFVRNYARLVGIDPASINEQLDASIPSRDVEAHIESLPPATNGQLTPEPIPINVRMQDAQPRATWYPWLLGAMSSLAAVLVLAVLYYTFGPIPRDQSATVAQNQAAAPVQSIAAPSPAPQDDAVFNGANAGTTLIDQDQRGGVNLQLQLTQDSWLSVTVDGKRVVYETLPAGTVREFHGVREITLRAGNAGGVNATIDGRSLGSLGQHGQVEERVFAAKSAASSTGPRE